MDKRVPVTIVSERFHLGMAVIRILLSVFNLFLSLIFIFVLALALVTLVVRILTFLPSVFILTISTLLVAWRRGILVSFRHQ